MIKIQFAPSQGTKRTYLFFSFSTGFLFSKKKKCCVYNSFFLVVLSLRSPCALR
nr:hypothetical protein GZ17A3_11 [uncultured archaeon GZfos17A3]